MFQELFQVSADDPRFLDYFSSLLGAEIMCNRFLLKRIKSMTLEHHFISCPGLGNGRLHISWFKKQLSNDRVTELRDAVNNAAAESFAAQIPVINTALKKHDGFGNGNN